jgi:hypothetical protein
MPRRWARTGGAPVAPLLPSGLLPNPRSTTVFSQRSLAVRPPKIFQQDSTGSLQAVRAQFRYLGSASSCTTGSYNDHDDLVFAVN